MYIFTYHSKQHDPPLVEMVVALVWVAWSEELGQIFKPVRISWLKTLTKMLMYVWMDFFFFFCNKSEALIDANEEEYMRWKVHILYDFVHVHETLIVFLSDQVVLVQIAQTFAISDNAMKRDT